MIAEPLLALAEPIDGLRLLDGNPRRGDVDAVASSLREFGQRKPIVAKSDGEVIAGNHTLLAARQLGWDQIAVVRVDDDEIRARAFALADNRTSDLGDYDDALLAQMVREVLEADESLAAAASWYEDDLQALTDEPPPGGWPKPEPSPLVCPACGHEWSGT